MLLSSGLRVGMDPRNSMSSEAVPTGPVDFSYCSTYWYTQHVFGKSSALCTAWTVNTHVALLLKTLLVLHANTGRLVV